MGIEQISGNDAFAYNCEYFMVAEVSLVYEEVGGAGTPVFQIPSCVYRSIQCQVYSLHRYT
jgi:hypothetical protein